MSDKKSVQHVWNTGRFYQGYGQVIAADIRLLAHTEYIVHFRDVSRMIDGQFCLTDDVGAKIMAEGPLSLSLRDLVMFYYDRGYYTGWWRGSDGSYEQLYDDLRSMADDLVKKLRSRTSPA